MAGRSSRSAKVGCRRAGTLIVMVVLAAAVPVPRVEAFKPYTHNRSGFDAYSDAVDNGKVWINGNEYTVPPKLVAALQAYPEYYNAGVIGPDGFPDLTMGQSIIHPVDTGKWLAYLLDAAWDAQDSDPEPGPPDLTENPSQPDYTDAEEKQILAFTYGFMTHAAGDVWAHTMINELSGEVFPAVGEILNDTDMAAIALRHILLEGYVGAATVGYDNNPDVTSVNGDLSDDSTPQVPFNAPMRFVYDALVDPANTATPSPERGPAIGFFTTLRNELDTFLTTPHDPLQAAIDAFDDFQAQVDLAFAPAHCDGLDNDNDGTIDEGCIGTGPLFTAGDNEDDSGGCSFGIGDTVAGAVIDIATDLVECPVVLGVALISNTAEAAAAAAAQALAAAAQEVFGSYVQAWIADIDDGLVHWGDIGLATTKALFDPQTRREAQNDICSGTGADTLGNTVRRACEDGVGVIDVVLWAADDFINDHLLSMLGAPDFIGDLRSILGDFFDEVDDFIGPALNPLRAVGLAVNEFAKGIVKDILSERFGLPIEEIETLFEDPTTRLDLENFSVTVAGQGTLNVPLLGPAVRAKLDGYLGLGEHDPFEPLAAGEIYSPSNFKAFGNTVTMAKLLLLDGDGMDAVLSDLVGGGRPYELYGTGTAAQVTRSNIMTTTFPGVTGADPAQWLVLIDGDHSWRQDGLPVFDNPNHISAGNGNFPLFESCILRDRAFRVLFDDWENDDTPVIGDNDGVLDPEEDFPDFNDTVSLDPNDSDDPEATLTPGYPNVVDGTDTWVKSNTPLTLEASDGFWLPDEMRIEWRAGSAAWADAVSGDEVDLTGSSDGPITVDYVANDPCRSGSTNSSDLIVDDTEPTVTFNAPLPDPTVYDTDDQIPLNVTVTDGSGVGVNSNSYAVSLDSTPISLSYTIDTFTLTTGQHTVTVEVEDDLGNQSIDSVTFKILATSASLVTNIDRAFTEGKITKSGVYGSLKTKLRAAQQAHVRGQHATEWSQLASFILDVLAQRGKSIDPATADRLIAYARDLIASRG